MRELSFPVPDGYDGIRLKNFLRGCCGVSSRLMIRLKREPMGITRNGLHAIVTETLYGGDIIRLRMPDDIKQQEPAEAPLITVYEDDDLLIVNKPAYMPMYPSPGHDRDSLANVFSARCLQREERIAFRPVYRLDRDTTGLVVLAKNPYSAARLAGQIGKEYIAVCEGELSGTGEIDAPIARKEGHGIQREVAPHGETAVTRWCSLGVGSGYSLLALELETGRTHQIRVHLSYLGHPLAGDDFYGGRIALITRQALHCGSVSFMHPYSGRAMHFDCALPEDMAALLFSCGIQYTQKRGPDAE
jgi:pseudouridine synthase, RluA family